MHITISNIHVYVSIILFGTCLGYYAEYPTVMEDVAGEYTLKSLKDLLINKTGTLTLAMKSVIQKLTEMGSGLKNSQYDAISNKIGRPVQQGDFKNLINEAEETRKTTASQLTTVEFNILESIAKLPSILINRTKEIFSKLTQSASLNLASDCYDLLILGYNSSGSYWLQKFGIRVLCDMETDDGGWLVIQKRAKVNEQVNFDQNWSKYKIGFGNIDTEFWIGNDILHILTNQKQYELLIEMFDFEKGNFYARYSHIRVGNEDSSYALEVGNYTGNSTDAFSYHHGRPFTTTDRDGDAYSTGNCADYFSGGWWYDKCYDAHLNGIYPNPPNRSNASFITWWSRDDLNDKKVPLVLVEVTIKIRPFIED